MPIRHRGGGVTRSRRWLPLGGLLLVIGLLLTALVPTGAAAAGEPPLDLSNPAQVAAFVDQYIAEQMAAAHVPGAVAVFVKDGAVLYQRGYGVADLARGTPVDPEATLFRVASVSKLLTTTAVMRLADQGQLRLDADVNQYLRDLRVPATYPRPVTLADLLTHTAGFEDRSIGYATLRAQTMPALDDYLASRMPARVRPPGAAYSYSNYSFALAGGGVQAVARQPFEDYMARQVLGPLGMEHTTFRQPLPPELAGSLATGYDAVGARVTPAPFEYFADPPARAMSTTAADMARFLIDQLGDGPTSGRVLSDAARLDMQRTHFLAMPGDNVVGMAYGYDYVTRNGLRILSKDGSDRGFASYLSLWPEQHFGFFLAANTNNSEWPTHLEWQLAKRAFPHPAATAPAVPAELAGSLAAFTGTYVSIQSSQTTIEKLRTLTDQVYVSDAGAGTLALTSDGGWSLQITRVAPATFAYLSDGVVYQWPFLTGPDGRATGFLAFNEGYERVPWYETRAVQTGLVAGFVLLFLAGLCALLLPPLLRRLRRRPPGRPSRGAGAGRVLGAAVCALNLAAIGGILLVLATATATQGLGYSWATYGTPPLLYVVLALPLLALAAAAGLLAAAVLGWRRGWSRWQYGSALSVLLVQAAFIPWLIEWNLLGFHL